MSHAPKLHNGISHPKNTPHMRKVDPSHWSQRQPYQAPPGPMFSCSTPQAERSTRDDSLLHSASCGSGYIALE
ncbi:hypothetical protein PGT21_018287 [Puccinia graminis f. sp. tritici]|uniref:Uncharacterized protein n=1 Tax=Puccinia graminis f. sp. tritici TaxID=56615 RepID=A0A5B0P9I3_PUCGR|nr:hypothetical protein PGT21_018287 [Puccinia graminis f. sp. tritici]KAA1126041.1 hypothetical protein PGTUg99_016757 [Puccinia graminis f. sp. tritici]